MIAIANEVNEFVGDADYHPSDSVLVEKFNKHAAPHFLWVYEEVRNRGHRDDGLDRYFDDPSKLRNVRHIASKLRELGSRLPLYQD